ncbi:CD48 antigen isoform X2 [Silurus asotus]|uniref:CD48 antigen isoform X2 n=1 Tax=Silurus asotus TaxID=30991 RepID=A0AAD5AT00_SILAS|nr:CD48 antigen isoform X2 [Silurus asotus]
MAAGAFSLVFVALYIFSAGSVEVKKFATGSTQTLSVNAQRDLKFLEWKHNGNLVVEWYGVGDPTQYRYRDHAKLNTNNGELTIKMLKDYSGEYKCQYLYTDVGTFEEKIFQVEVIGSEKFATGSTQTLSVNAQRDLKFIEWKHNGKLVVEWYGVGDPTQYRYHDHAKLNTNTGELTIKMLKDYSGEYKCQYQYTDADTFEEKIFQVEVIGSEKFATGSTQTLSVNAQRDLKFIEWKHNGKLVVEWYGVGDPTQYRYHDHAKLNTNTGELTIKMLKDYSGEYKCQYLYTDADTFEEKIFQVEVIDPVSKPNVTCEKNGTNITLKCTMDSSAQANFKWKGPDDFSHVGESVHITNPETKDLYFCTATNEVSEETAEFELTGCPRQGSEKFATGSTQTLSVNAERALKLIEWKHNGNLVVEWHGVGKPTQYRYYDHAKLNINNGVLTIKMLKVYSGEYKCQYQYKDADTFQEKIFQVEVIGSVEVKKFATGSTQTLSVNAERDLKLIEWKHNGNLVVEWHGVGDPTQYRYDDYAKLNTNNGVLTIKMLKDYSGEYKCQYQYTDVDTFQEKIFQVEVIGQSHWICSRVTREHRVAQSARSRHSDVFN